MRDAAKALLASCSAQRAKAGGREAPPQALALLRLWDGSPGGLPPAVCRQHAGKVRPASRPASSCTEYQLQWKPRTMRLCDDETACLLPCALVFSHSMGLTVIWIIEQYVILQAIQ